MKLFKAFVICLMLCFGALSADTAISGTISTSQTWNLAGSPYLITGTVNVQGTSTPIVTIEAGVQVRFSSMTSINLGSSNNPDQRGGMVVNGTPTDPVLFTANTATPVEGWWGSINSQYFTSDSNIIFNHAILEYGGSGTGLFSVISGNPVFSNCVFRESANYGIYHGGNNVSASISNCSFQNNLNYPLFWNPQFVSQIGGGNSFSGNNPDRILIKSQILTVGAVWSDKGVPFEMELDLTLENGANPLVLQPGVELLFKNVRRLYVGHASNTDRRGSLSAEGAVLAAGNPAQGWNGIYFNTYTEPSVFNNCTIRNVGSAVQGAVFINGDRLAEFENCLFTSNNTAALYSNSGKAFSLAGCSISNNAKTVTLYACDLHKLLAGNQYLNNTENRIHCLGGTIGASAVWTAQSTPIWASGAITLDAEGPILLQIPSGVELQFATGTCFYVGSTSYATHQPSLSATGATFRAADPTAGWNGVVFYTHIGASTLQSCSLRDVVYVANFGAVTVNSLNLVTINDCLFNSNATYAVFCQEGKNFAMSGCVVDTNAKTVSVAARDVQKILTGNQFLNNTDNRLHCRGGNIIASASWTYQGIPILVSDNITLDAEGTLALTLPYGTELQFASGKLFTVGSTVYSVNQAALLATGVIFRGVEPTPGYWIGLLFNTHGCPSLLSGCTIRDAGYTSVAAVRFNVTNATLTGCFIHNNLAGGIYLADNCEVAVSGNTVTACGSYPLSLHVDKLRLLTGQNQLTGNTTDQVQLRGGTVATSGIWYNPGVPLLLTTHCYISSVSAPHIQIMPGTVLMLPHLAGLYVGNNAYSDRLGSLSAEGVTFTRSVGSAVPAGLVFYRYATPGASHLISCVFEYLRQGNTDSAVYVDGNDPVLEGCVFRSNPARGLVVLASGRATTLNCQFLNNGGYPISAAAVNFDAVSGTGNYFSGNNPDRILISGGTLSQDYTWDNPSVPVEVSTSITVDAADAAPILKINSGLVLLFRSAVSLNIGNTTYSNHSGGLQGDGATFSALSGTAGGWGGIQFLRFGRSDSYLSYCVIEYAGSNGNIYLSNSPLAYIDSCVIRYGTNGIYANGASSCPSISKNYIENNGVGIYCTNSANPLISGSGGNANSITGNTTYGVQNTSTAITVHAEYNWWGHEFGPTHAGNPSGAGDAVTNYVDYDPYRDTDIGDAPARFHLLSPANASVLATLTPVLDWEEAIDPTPGDMVTYTLEIAEDSGLNVGLISISGLSSTVYHVSASTLDDDTRYYWRVIATDTQMQTTNSYESYWCFDTAVPEAPLPFDLLSPAYNATVYYTSNFLSWLASSDPDPGDMITYTVYQDVSAGFENAQTFTTANTQIYSGFCVPGSLIYWKVKATDLTNRETFSPVWRFFVDPNAKPRAPVYFTLTPSGLDILIAWDEVPGADSYDIYASSDPYTGFSLLQSGLTSPSCPHYGAANQPRQFYYVITHDTQ